MRETSFNVFLLDEDESAALLLSSEDRLKGSAYLQPGSVPDSLLRAEAEAMKASGLHEEPS